MYIVIPSGRKHLLDPNIERGEAALAIQSALFVSIARGIRSTHAMGEVLL